MDSCDEEYVASHDYKVNSFMWLDKENGGSFVVQRYAVWGMPDKLTGVVFSYCAGTFFFYANATNDSRMFSLMS